MDQKLARERTSGGRGSRLPKPLIVGAVFVSAVGVLIWQVAASMIPVIKIHQLFAEEHGGKVQVDNGEIISIESIAPLQFTVGVKQDPETRLLVKSTVSVPDNFKVGIPVSLRGTYDTKTKIFNAYRITTQCPSRYEATKEAYEAAGATRYEGATEGSTAERATEPAIRHFEASGRSVVDP